MLDFTYFKMIKKLAELLKIMTWDPKNTESLLILPLSSGQNDPPLGATNFYYTIL